MRVPVNFGRHSHQARAGTISPQRLVNLYAEVMPADDKVPVTVLGTSGLFPLIEVGTGPIWGLRLLGSLIYAVSGNSVYTIDSIGTITNLGSIGTVDVNVDIDDNGEEVIIVNSGAGWLATPTALTQITDGDFLTPSSVTAVDGFAIFTQSGTDTFFKSAQLDASVYDALDFDVADGDSDILVKAKALQKELWLFGERSTEIWYNAGGGGFPYQRIQGGFLNRGCAAKLSVAREDNSLYWLGDDRIFYRNQGYAFERISTHAVEDKVRQYTTISDAHSFIYTENGHKFYCTTFPTELKTWCFDIATAAWHERESYEEGRWRANAFVNAFGKNLVGDFENGNIYELDLDTYSENSEPLVRKAVSGVVSANTNRFIVDEFVLDIEAGVGLLTGQGSDPTITLRFSDDGGKTWSYEMTKSLGAIGEYKTQVKWQRLGQASKGGRIFEVSISDPVKIAIGGAYAILTPCEN